MCQLAVTSFTNIQQHAICNFVKFDMRVPTLPNFVQRRSGLQGNGETIVTFALHFATGCGYHLYEHAASQSNAAKHGPSPNQCTTHEVVLQDPPEYLSACLAMSSSSSPSVPTSTATTEPQGEQAGDPDRSSGGSSQLTGDFMRAEPVFESEQSSNTNSEMPVPEQKPLVTVIWRQVIVVSSLKLNMLLTACSGQSYSDRDIFMILH